MNTRKDNWYLKVGDETQYGPVPFSTLVTWSRQGRVVAGNSVSHDRREWIPAEKIPEFAMTLMIEDENGVLSGPFNREALRNSMGGREMPETMKMFEIEPGGEARDKAVASLAGGKEPSSKSKSTTMKNSEQKQENQKPRTTDAGVAEKSAKTGRDDGKRREAALLETQRREFEAEQKVAAEKFALLESRIKSLEKERDEALEKALEAVDLKKLNRDLTSSLKELRADYETQQEELSHAGADQTGPAGDGPEKLRELTEALEQERAKHAQTLQAANDRDTAMRQELDSLQKALARQAETATGKAAGSGFPDSVVSLVRGWLSEDRDLYVHLRDRSVERQEELQAAFKEWARSEPVRPVPAGAVSAGEMEQQLSELREERLKENAAAQDRERELRQRIRVMENQELRLRDRVSSLESGDESPAAMLDRLRQGEKDYELLNKRYEEEGKQWAGEKKALLGRIEELERAAGTLPGLEYGRDDMPGPPRKPASQATGKGSQVSGTGKFRVTPWMRLK